MKAVLFRCPKQQIAVPTGRFTTEQSFRLLSLGGMIANCPACGDGHRWEPRDAWLVDAQGDEWQTPTWLSVAEAGPS